MHAFNRKLITCLYGSFTAYLGMYTLMNNFAQLLFIKILVLVYRAYYLLDAIFEH